MLKLDLHIHSQYSEDGAGTPELIIKSLQKKGIHGMAITDHNTVEGSLKALKVAPKNFIVIPGVEISTADGHIIALNVKENIPKGLNVVETVEKTIDLNGIPIVPHLYRTMSGVKEDKQLEKFQQLKFLTHVAYHKQTLKQQKLLKNTTLVEQVVATHIPLYMWDTVTQK
jgi:predicted metal-dependent phosphoesterase TrpH